jgi:hypothetical protein
MAMTRGKLTCLTLGLLSMLTGLVRADHARDCTCIVRLADELQAHSRDLSCEFERSFRWTRQYWDLQSRAQAISVSAGELKHLAQIGSDYRAMKCSLEEISDAYRTLNYMVSGSHGGHGSGHHGSGHYGSSHYGSGHSVAYFRAPEPCTNDRVRALMGCLDKTICKANEELGGLFVTQAPAPRRTQYDRRPSYDSPAGFTYGSPVRPSQSGFTYGNPVRPGQSGFTLSNGRLTFNFGR